MERSTIFALGLAVYLFSSVVVTGGFTGGDQAVQGVYLNPADTTNGDRFAEYDTDGRLRVDVTNLNARSTTILDSVFTVTSTHDRARVWIEPLLSAVTLYRMDTRQPIVSRSSAVRLSENETLTVGIKIDTGTTQVLSGQITVHAEIPTPTSGSTPTQAPTPVPTTTQPPTGTTTTKMTTETVTTVTGTVTTNVGTARSPTTTVTTGTARSPTTAPLTTTQPRTTTVAATPGTPTTGTPTPTTVVSGPSTGGTAEPGTAEAGTDEPGTPTGTVLPPTDATGTTAPSEETPTPTGTPTVPGTTSQGTDAEQFEIGGLSLPVIAALAGAVALLPLLFGLYRWLTGVPALHVRAGEGSGLRVERGSFDAEYYDTGDHEVSFRFTESDGWRERGDSGALTLSDLVHVTNETDQPLDVTPTVDEAFADDVRVLPTGAEAADASASYRLADGDTLSLTFEFADGFDSDDISVVFEARPPE